MYLEDLTAEEVVMLGHCLRMVPTNAVLTGNSAARLADGGVVYFSDIDAFKSLWKKTGEAISNREDCEPYRVNNA